SRCHTTGASTATRTGSPARRRSQHRAGRLGRPLTVDAGALVRRAANPHRRRPRLRRRVAVSSRGQLTVKLGDEDVLDSSLDSLDHVTNDVANESFEGRGHVSETTPTPSNPFGASTLRARRSQRSLPENENSLL